MKSFYKFIFYVAMLMMGVVSMWTTYVSLHDSILPTPVFSIPIAGKVFDVSVLALLLSVAIGMMIFALKVAIIDEQKHLNWLGVLGLTLIAFISIAFNMDVLYRTADREFFLRYSSTQMRGAYEQYLADVQGKLLEKQTSARKVVAKQEGEMEAEVKGLRQAPAGYGPIAKQEDYKLTLMAKEANVDLETVEQALKTKEKADLLLATRSPATLDEIQVLQNDLRVTLKDMSAATGIRLPDAVKTESPIFAVFQRLFDYHTIGFKEIFFLALAFLLDLGDICGYVLVGNKPRHSAVITPVPLGKSVSPRPSHPVFRTAERLSQPSPAEDAPSDYGNPNVPARRPASYRDGDDLISPAERA